MTATEALQIIETFKKGVPFTLPQIKERFPKGKGSKLFSVAVMWGKVEPTGEYKSVGFQDWTTPYFVFV